MKHEGAHVCSGSVHDLEEVLEAPLIPYSNAPLPPTIPTMCPNDARYCVTSYHEPDWVPRGRHRNLQQAPALHAGR